MFNFFKKKTLLDEVEETSVKLIRATCGPLNRSLTDDKILALAKQVMTEFQKAAELKSERISGKVLIGIAAQFVKLHDMFGEEHFQSHLKYETDKYLREGLRKDYKRYDSYF